MPMDDDAIPPVGSSESYPVILSSGHSPAFGGRKRRKPSKANSSAEEGRETKQHSEEEGHVDRYA